MAIDSIKQFRLFLDPYYWKSAYLIASCGVAKKYQNSYLGVLWLLLPSIAIMCIFIIIMPMIMKIDAASYASYLLSTFPLWIFVSSSLSSAPFALVNNAETLKRCIISSSVFPVADVLKNTYSYFTGFAGMILIGIIFGLSVSWHFLLFPIYIIPIILTVICLCVGIAYITPYVQDIKYAIELVMSVVVWGSAVFYPITSLPPDVQEIVRWSPIYILFEPIIYIIHHHQIPSFLVTAKLLGLMCISVIFAYSLYRIGRRNFVYYL